MMSILMKNNNIFRLFSLSILMCDLYKGDTILPEFRTKGLIHGCGYTRVITVGVILDRTLGYKQHIHNTKMKVNSKW